MNRTYQCPVSGWHYDALKLWNDLWEANADKSVEVIRECFSLPAIDKETGIGFTDDEVQKAFASFKDFLVKKDVRGDSSRSSAPCTGCP